MCPKKEDPPVIVLEFILMVADISGHSESG
jgi:hypothetical protein